MNEVRLSDGDRVDSDFVSSHCISSLLVSFLGFGYDVKKDVNILGLLKSYWFGGW